MIKRVGGSDLSRTQPKGALNTMRTKYILSALLSASLIAGPVNVANANDFAAGLVGGIIAGAAISHAQKNRRTTTRRTYKKRSTISSAQRAENRSVQHALNYFGFHVGGADGSLGPRSRAGISSYQAHMGFSPTGYLNDYEKTFLLTSHNRALAGGPATSQQIARLGGVTSGLLHAYRDEAAGGTGFATAGNYGGLPNIVARTVDEIAQSSDPTGQQLVQRSGFIQLADMNGDGQTDYLIDTSVTGSAFWCNAQSCAVRVFVSTPTGYERNDFQAFNVSPAMFACNRGLCEMSGSNSVLAQAPVPQFQQPQAPQATLVGAGVNQAATTPVPSAVPSVQPTLPQPVAAAPAAAGLGVGLPTFLAKPEGEASLASHCNQVSLVTNTNGGFTTLASMSDPERALNEQFCLARTYAISHGETLMSKVTGVTTQEVEAQCHGLGAALSKATAALSLRPVGTVRQEVASVVLASGLPPAALIDTAKICLGVGYRTDDMDIGISAALLLVTLGEGAYAELIGHHLAQGFGASKRVELALPWYEMGIDAAQLRDGAVFAPAQPERNELVRLAAARLAGKPPSLVILPVDAPAQPEAGSTFVISK